MPRRVVSSCPQPYYVQIPPCQRYPVPVVGSHGGNPSPNVDTATSFESPSGESPLAQGLPAGVAVREEQRTASPAYQQRALVVTMGVEQNPSFIYHGRTLSSMSGDGIGELSRRRPGLVFGPDTTSSEDSYISVRRVAVTIEGKAAFEYHVSFKQPLSPHGFSTGAIDPSKVALRLRNADYSLDTTWVGPKVGLPPRKLGSDDDPSSAPQLSSGGFSKALVGGQTGGVLRALRSSLPAPAIPTENPPSPQPNPLPKVDPAPTPPPGNFGGPVPGMKADPVPPPGPGDFAPPAPGFQAEPAPFTKSGDGDTGTPPSPPIPPDGTINHDGEPPPPAPLPDPDRAAAGEDPETNRGFARRFFGKLWMPGTPFRIEDALDFRDNPSRDTAMKLFDRRMDDVPVVPLSPIFPSTYGEIKRFWQNPSADTLLDTAEKKVAPLPVLPFGGPIAPEFGDLFRFARDPSADTAKGIVTEKLNSIPVPAPITVGDVVGIATSENKLKQAGKVLKSKLIPEGSLVDRWTK